MLQLLDLAGIYYRAYYALPASLKSPGGMSINAIRGSLDIMTRVLADAKADKLVACLDLDWRPAFRVAAIPSYKAHRVLPAAPPTDGGPEEVAPDGPEEVPDDLSPQVPVLLEVLAAIGITVAGAPGFEADDVIGTLVHQRTEEVEVVTGDRDLYQVAVDGENRCRVRYIGAGMSKVQLLGAGEVASKHGIPVGRYADFAALRGDPSDGLPGVPGIGDKTAAALVSQFGSLEDLAQAAEDPTSAMPPAQRRKLIAARDYLAVAGTVVRVATGASIIFDPEGDPTLPTEPVDATRLRELVAQYGISAPVNRLVAYLATRS
ncbi:5'-3' exonuclease [Nakamurella antarctica]|uniref:5'-3' exonuclease n=1 Tax=Nakamurella antarctica TaxID=1902245 RepID=A0A3G8ZL44_9ACTN|nr:5'-3' exonuclease [Nakamurella antarctica]AZI57920.1 5'-3' exonuclease [Nakamurella antarctica]